jgi:YggT family protein
MGLIRLALTLLLWVLIIGVVISWIEAIRPVPYSSPFRPAVRAVSRFTNAVFRPFRNLVPPIRVGGAALDVSPIIVFIILNVLLVVLPR